MLEVNSLSVYKKDGNALFEVLSFTLNKNDKIGLIGDEGNGKTALFKAINNYPESPMPGFKIETVQSITESL